MALDKIQRFTNREYNYRTDDDSFIARGLHLNEINDALSMVIDEVNAGSGGLGAGSGLTENAGNVDLGGTLLGATTLSFDETANFILSGDRSGVGSSRAEFTYNNFFQSVSPTSPYAGGNARSEIALSGTTAVLRWYNSGYQASGISFTASAIQIIDAINSKGAVYTGNYDTNGILDDNWIPSYRAVKAYADSVGGGSYTFDSGITEAAGNVDLGGALTSNATITGGASGRVRLEHSFATFRSAIIQFNGDAPIDILVYADDDYTGYESGLNIGEASVQIKARSAVSDQRSITVSTSAMTIADATLKGLVYAADYDTAGILDDNWIPSYRAVKAYADSVGGGVTLANGVDDRVVTALGTASLNGEANLTFNGTILTVSANMSLTGNAVNFSGLGSDDTEDHVIAIDDATGLLTKRSVASIGGGSGTVTSVGFTAGNLIDLSGDNPITTSGTVAIAVDLSELVTSTADGVGDYFAVVDSTNAQYKLTKANILLSGFSNDSGWDVGTVTQIIASTTPVDGLSLSGGTITGSGTIGITGNISVSSVTGVLPVANGGTGLATIATSTILTGNGTGALTAESSLTFNGSTLAVTGAITATGEITAYSSDKRLKTHIVRIPEPLVKVKLLDGVTYDWNEAVCERVGFVPARSHETGMIAQNLGSVIPDAISYAPFDRDTNGNSISGDAYLTVNLEKVIPLLVEAVKELTDRNEKLVKRVKQLENN